MRSWGPVQPEFRSAVSVPVHRDAPGFGKGVRYTNTTGRNNILASKVSFDARMVYFYVRTRDKLTPHTDHDWMRLYLNTDGNAANGWLGYDYAVNSRVGSRSTLLEKHAGDGYQWTPVGQVRYQARGNEMMIAIPRASWGSQRGLRLLISSGRTTATPKATGQTSCSTAMPRPLAASISGLN